MRVGVGLPRGFRTGAESSVGQPQGQGWVPSMWQGFPCLPGIHSPIGCQLLHFSPTHGPPGTSKLFPFLHTHQPLPISITFLQMPVFPPGSPSIICTRKKSNCSLKAQHPCPIRQNHVGSTQPPRNPPRALAAPAHQSTTLLHNWFPCWIRAFVDGGSLWAPLPGSRYGMGQVFNQHCVNERIVLRVTEQNT